MHIKINGKDIVIQEGYTISRLLEEYKMVPEAIVVEHNRSVLKKNEYSAKILKEHDEIEILTFMGGG